MPQNTTARRPQLRTELGSLVAALVLFGSGSLTLGAPSAGAQPRERPMSLTMVRRIAEIVDGNRSGNSIYIAVGYDFPHALRGVFLERDSIPDSLRTHRSIGVFGPYQTERSPSVFFVCPHDGNMSLYDDVQVICPERPPRPPITAIDKISLLLQMGARVDTILVNPRTDALFFTVAAMEKFVFPYYAKVLGIDTVAVIRQNFIRRFRAP